MPAPLYLAAALTLNAVANVLIKYAMTREVRPIIPVDGALRAFLSLPFLAGLACFAANLACYSLALRTMKISLAYPIMVSLGYIVILALSWFLFSERLTTVQYAGIGLILVGIWMVVR